jgi:hypothetical protein
MVSPCRSQGVILQCSMRMTEHLLIESNTKALRELDEKLKHPGPEDQDRVAAISQYSHRYDQLAFPGGLERGLALLDAGDARAIESALTFLEVNPLFHRSGYIKADLLRHLKRAPLSENQKSRLRKVVIARVQGSDSREFRHYARLAPTIADQSLRDALLINQASKDPVAARHAKWILQALGDSDFGDKPRDSQ